MNIVPQLYPTVILDFPPKPGQLYRLGWNAYCNGIPLAPDATEHEKRGWNAANRAHAEVLTPGYAESMSW